MTRISAYILFEKFHLRFPTIPEVTREKKNREPRKNREQGEAGMEGMKTRQKCESRK